MHTNANLTPAQEAAKQKAIAECRATGQHSTAYPEGEAGDAYAYPHADGVAWGVNGATGFNIARGIMPK